jgi:hypothetical protein
MKRAILIGSAILLSACTTQERVRVQTVNIPVSTPCPAAKDVPAKPVKPALPNGLEAALRVAVAHAARLSGWGDDLSGRLAACREAP